LPGQRKSPAKQILQLRALGVPAGATHRTAPPRLGQRARQFLGQLEQRVGGAGHDILRDLSDPPAA
jgi:hypothetical protein